MRQTPWHDLGMSRATWYRRGKPITKPAKRVTLAEAARQMQVSLRGTERARRIDRYSPELAADVVAGKITLGEADRLIAFVLKARGARERRGPR